MLPLFRSKKEWLKWILVLVILALGLTTVFLFVRTPTGLTPGVGAREVAVVAGQPITAAEYGRYYRRLLDTYRQVYSLTNQNDDMLSQFNLEQQALTQLINRYAVVHAAGEFGIGVSKTELVDSISRLFQEDGQFIGKDRYQDILRSNNMTAKEFEDSMRRDLLNNKLRNVLVDGIYATPDEVRKQFVEINQQARIAYALYDPAELGRISASDERLQEYYAENQEAFRQEEQRRISYLLAAVSPADVEVTEDQVSAELPNVPGGEQVRAKHILIRFGDDEDAARSRAEDILREVRAGGVFEELAERYSEDPGSALRGGDLGFFGKGQMVPEFEAAAFGLEPGQVSGLVRTSFGFHIIKSITLIDAEDDTSRRPYADFFARRNESERQSEELSNRLWAAVNEGGKTLEQVAEENSLTVAETAFFEKNEPIARMGLGQDFKDKVFSMSPGELAGPFGSAGRYYIIRLEEINASVIPEYSEVSAEVRQRFEEEEGDNLARDKAFELFNDAQKGESLQAVAEGQNLKVTVTDFFKRNAPINEELTYAPSVAEESFKLDVGEVATPIRISGKYIVFELVELSDIDEELFESQKEQLQEQLNQQKRNEFYREYVENVVDELRRDERIIINQQLVDDLVGRS